MIYIIAILTFVSTAIGGLLAVKFRDKLHLILGFSAGAVLGVALFDLIPESIELTEKYFDMSFVMLLIAFGFCAYMILDRFLPIHNHRDEHCDNPAHQHGLGPAALVFHTFLDGLTVGLAFQVSNSVGLIVAVAVLVHDFSDGINTVGMALRDKQNDKSNAIKWLIADAIAPMFGVMVSMLVNIPQKDLGLILAVFAGFFLYLSAGDLIPESHHRHPAAWTTFSTIIGLIIIYLAVSFAK